MCHIVFLAFMFQSTRTLIHLLIETVDVALEKSMQFCWQAHIPRDLQWDQCQGVDAQQGVGYV